MPGVRTYLLAVLATWLGCVGFYGQEGEPRSNADGDIDADADGDDDGDSDIDADEDELSDRDGDTISDADEDWGTVDSDSDGVPDMEDLDSDNDGIPDATEAGDADLHTPPVDTDADGTPDFRDRDSDDDGLRDHDEAFVIGSDPRRVDSDGDGVSDLVEYSADTDPLDAADNPEVRGDLVFVVPHMGAPDPTAGTLEFSTTLRRADVYFLVDCTGSMMTAQENLRTSLTTTIVPGILDSISDAHFGVGMFQDYGYGSYGSSDNVAYRNLQCVTDDVDAVEDAAASLVASGGNDGPEALVPALHAVATGCGDWDGIDMAINAVPDDPDGACEDGSLIGYPHFRSTAIPIIVLITDAASHNGPDGRHTYGPIPGVVPPTYDTTVSTLDVLHAWVIGIDTSFMAGGEAHDDLVALAEDTGSFDSAGRPLVYEVAYDASDLGDQVVLAVEAIVAAPRTISTSAVDSPDDDVDAVAAFIERIVTSGSRATCSPGLETTDTDGDGHDDTYVNVATGATACFEVVARQNTTVPPRSMPTVYVAKIHIWADNASLVDQREVYFLVPLDRE